MMDLRIRLMLWASRRKFGDFDPAITIERFRKAYVKTNEQFGLPDEGGVGLEDVRVPIDSGSILARFYRPAAIASPAPALLYFHGGGFSIGDVPSYDHLCRFFARVGNLVVVSIDYRLGPEFRFPHAHEDAFAALGWLQTHATSFGIDPERIAVGGDSAGGNLAAALSALATERGLKRPAYQYLIYPSVDAAHAYPSAQTHVKRLPLTPAQMAYFSKQYANSPSDGDSFLLSPLRAPHPENLPPTYLLAAKYDPLAGEGKAYADRLAVAGVDVTYDLASTLPHAFVNLAGAVPRARKVLERSIRTVSGALRSPS